MSCDNLFDSQGWMSCDTISVTVKGWMSCDNLLTVRVECHVTISVTVKGWMSCDNFIDSQGLNVMRQLVWQLRAKCHVTISLTVRVECHVTIWQSRGGCHMTICVAIKGWMSCDNLTVMVECHVTIWQSCSNVMWSTYVKCAIWFVCKRLIAYGICCYNHARIRRSISLYNIDCVLFLRRVNSYLHSTNRLRIVAHTLAVYLLNNTPFISWQQICYKRSYYLLVILQDIPYSPTRVILASNCLSPLVC